MSCVIFRPDLARHAATVVTMNPRAARHVEYASLAASVAAIVGRLRTTTASRLAAPLSGPYACRADAGRLLARSLAVAAQGIEDAASPAPPAWRTPPALPDLAVGDEVNVLAQDFFAALENAPLEVWAPDGRTSLDDIIADVAATVAEVARVVEAATPAR